MERPDRGDGRRVFGRLRALRRIHTDPTRWSFPSTSPPTCFCGPISALSLLLPESPSSLSDHTRPPLAPTRSPWLHASKPAAAFTGNRCSAAPLGAGHLQRRCC
ncbi:hypothetical protein VPH35_013020 [Triticum aestivum]